MASNFVSKNLNQHAFTTGEVSPAFLGRQDVAKYASGLQVCQNFQVIPQGGIYNDTGTVMVAQGGVMTSKIRVLPFVFSNTQAYTIEIGNQYARFYTNNGQIQSPPGTPYQITTPYLSADLALIQYCQSGDFLYLVHPNYPPAAITRMSNVSWAYNVLTFADGPYQNANLNNTQTMTASAISGAGITITANFNAFFAGNVGATIRLEEGTLTYYNQWTSGVCYQPGELVSNAGSVYSCTQVGPTIPQWAASTVYATQLVQNAGHLYVANGTANSTPPTQTSGTVTLGATYTYLGEISGISQRALGQWQSGVAYPIGYYVYWGANCYVSQAAGTSGGAPPTWTNSATDGGVTWGYLGERSGTRAPIHSVGSQSDGNLSWAFQNSGFGYATITGYTSPTQVTANVIVQFPASATGGTLRWRLGAFDLYNGYPGTVCFYEQRLCFGGTPNFPQDIWMSNTGDYYNFQPTSTATNVLATNSIHITLASNTINQIVWMSPQTRLLVGTIGAEWQIWQASTSSGFSPSNLQAKPMTSNGSAPLPATRVGLTTLYVHRSQWRTYEMTYQYLYDLYTSKDQNLIAEHILRQGGGIVDTAYQLTPYSNIWYLRADGVLVGFTDLEDEQETAWHTHVYQGAVEAICVIPGPNNVDQLWMVVNRTVNGQTVRYIERKQDPYYPANPQDKASMWYVECGLSYVGATSTVGGLGYLQGLAVVPIVDGAVQPTQVVPPSGIITLQTAAKTQVVVGLPYASTLTILPLDFEGQQGSIIAQTKRVQRARLVVLNSIGFTIFAGTQSNPQGPAGVVQSFRNTTDPDSVGPALFTGAVLPLVSMQPSPDGVYTIQQTQPYPLNILSLISEVTAYEQ